MNALLIASRGLSQRESCARNTRTVFVEDVRVPGYWGGACAGCKWKDHGARCSYSNRGEPKYEPSDLALLPRGAIEELED